MYPVTVAVSEVTLEPPLPSEIVAPGNGFPAPSVMRILILLAAGKVTFKAVSPFKVIPSMLSWIHPGRGSLAAGYHSLRKV